MSARSPVGAVFAMRVELMHFVGRGTVDSIESVGPWTDWHARIGSHAVVATLAGVGMVNAAAGTEHLITRYRPRAIVNSGCTGGHLDELVQGDVVIGTETVYHAALQVLADGSERHAGFAFDTIDGTVNASSLLADPELLGIANEVAKSISLPAWPADLTWDAPEPRRAARIVAGPVASADIWTQHVERLDTLHARHGTLCEDMEAAAVNQITARYRLPFLTVKDIINNERHAKTTWLESDLAFEPQFPIGEAGRRSAILLAEVVQRYAGRG